MKNLLFVCGALRSGTTLLHLLMDNHSEISNKGEFDFLVDRIKDSPPSANEYYTYLENHRIFLSHNLFFPDNGSSYSDIIYSFIEQLTTDSEILALNVHRNFEKIPEFFSTAKYLHLIMDPRDVAKSSVGMGWAGNVYYGVDHWINSEKSWLALRNQIAPDQFYEVYFEELIESPEQTLIGICSFLGIDFDKKMLTYDKSSTYDKPDKKLMNQWLKRLTIKEIELVETKAADLMLNLGYELHTSPSAKLNWGYCIYLKLHNKFFRSIYAIKKYGVVLFIEDKLSQILKIESMVKDVQLKKNRIDTKFLK